MTLATHSVVGGIIAASLAPVNPALGVTFAFISHFALDAIPHWDYKLLAFEKDENNEIKSRLNTGQKEFYLDLVKIGFDFALGLVTTAILALLTGSNLWLMLAGAVAGAAPDALQFAYYKLGGKALTALQTFHLWIHADLRLKLWPGIFYQIIGVFILVMVSYIYLLK